MTLPDLFHFYLSGFLGFVVLVWSWEKIRQSFQRRKVRVQGKCPICQTPWQGELDVFQRRCEACGFRIKTPSNTRT